ncbi:hypothetical protein GE21DRAFT_1333504 [Neurospora crassa]|nr:hypothetical protein GE21DRAFT_1333504 [Neurospora crassa]
MNADVASWEKEVVAGDEHIFKIAFTIVASIMTESQCRLDFKREARLAYNKEYKKNRLDNETPDEREAT